MEPTRRIHEACSERKTIKGTKKAVGTVSLSPPKSNLTIYSKEGVLAESPSSSRRMKLKVSSDNLISYAIPTGGGGGWKLTIAIRIL